MTSSSLREESTRERWVPPRTEPRSPRPTIAEGASGSPGMRASSSNFGAMSAWPSRARARIAAAFQARSLLVCQIRRQLGDRLGLGNRRNRLDGLLSKIHLREVLECLGVALTEPVAAQECDELSTFVISQAPRRDAARRTGGLVGINLAEGLNGVCPDLPLPGDQAALTRPG